MSEDGTLWHAPNVPRQFVRIDQVKLLIEFMAQHVDFAAGKSRTLEARLASKALWEKLASMLNECNGGVKKTADGWSKFWSDWKKKLKNRMQLARKKGAHVVKLTRLEKRALDILGPGFAFEMKRRKVISNGTGDFKNNPLRNHCSSKPHPIKLEVLHEVDSANITYEDQNSDDNSEYNIDTDANNSEENANDLNNIYPSWLVEVEKKRAEAELCRARAEQARARAARLQAGALGKLAEATSKQAEALMRIAMVMESRRESDSSAV